VPSAKAEYRLAPDGLPARSVGPWVERKVHYVDRYASIFATGMKKWGHRGYIELFSGPGISYDKGHHRFIDGSALRALQMNFTHCAFVDLDPIAVGALAARVAARGQQARAAVFEGDCNEAVPRLRSAIPSDALTLAFVDPTNWQVKLSTIAALVESRRIDLLMTFHAGSMVRVSHLAECNLDEFFDTGAWRDALNKPRYERLDALLGLYNRKLGELGYLPSSNLRVAVKNTRGRVLYDLVLFSRNPRGIDFWQKSISGVDESGLRGFWDI
jgi:three-Cys-motif partner protein